MIYVLLRNFCLPKVMKIRPLSWAHMCVCLCVCYRRAAHHHPVEEDFRRWRGWTSWGWGGPEITAAVICVPSCHACNQEWKRIPLVVEVLQMILPGPLNHLCALQTQLTVLSSPLKQGENEICAPEECWGHRAGVTRFSQMPAVWLWFSFCR